MAFSVEPTGSPDWIRYSIHRDDGLSWNGEHWSSERPLLFYRLREAPQALQELEEQEYDNNSDVGG